MKGFVFLMAVLSVGAFGRSVVCYRDGMRLSFEAYTDRDPVTLHGFTKDGDVDAGYRQFHSLLERSKCRDMAGYIDIKRSEVLVCGGEMYIPNGIYGQVITTTGGLENFLQLAAKQYWICK